MSEAARAQQLRKLPRPSVLKGQREEAELLSEARVRWSNEEGLPSRSCGCPEPRPCRERAVRVSALYLPPIPRSPADANLEVSSAEGP